MERVPLITVETTFCLGSELPPERRMLVVHPDLSVPPTGWKERTEAVTVLRPDGREFEAAARISLSHINFKMSERHLTTVDQRWRVTVLFYGMTRDDVPDGSKILVSHETRNALLPKTSASSEAGNPRH
jgi:hypothetical protein